MKNIKLFIAVFIFFIFSAACKASHCDCPSFRPKSQIEVNQEISLFV